MIASRPTGVIPFVRLRPDGPPSTLSIASGRLVGILSLHDIARAAVREGRWFARVRVSDVGRTFAQVSRPWAKPAPPPMRANEAMAE